MKVVTFAQLVALPAGTIFCEVEEGYATGLYRKGESGTDQGVEGPGTGFWKTELLPQRAFKDRTLKWQPTTWWPSNWDDEGGPGVFYVLDEEDVAEFVARIGGGA